MRVTFLLVVIPLFWACTDKEILNCGPEESYDVTYGSSYIGCEVGPFFINIEDMMDCTISLPMDSIYSSSWTPGCQMSQLQTDSSNSDFVFEYLDSGVFEIEVLNSDYSTSTWPFILEGELIDTSEYPYYGSLRVSKEGVDIQMVLMNRYIGGCFHDELIWRIIR